MRLPARARGTGRCPEQTATAAAGRGERTGRGFGRRSHRRRHGLYQGRAGHRLHHQFGRPVQTHRQTVQYAGRIVHGVRNRRTDHHFGGRRQDHPPGRQPDGRGRRHRYGYAAQSQRDGRRGGGRHQRPRTARDEYRQHARRPRPGRDFHPVER